MRIALIKDLRSFRAFIGTVLYVFTTVFMGNFGNSFAGVVNMICSFLRAVLRNTRTVSDLCRFAGGRSENYLLPCKTALVEDKALDLCG